MSAFNLSDEEKEEILKKHKEATKEVRDRQEWEKGGLKAPEKTEEKKD